ncbi:MAG: cyclic nucleotide-binding domain-containing protein [Thermodesulfobacteriota bacterium]
MAGAGDIAKAMTQIEFFRNFALEEVEQLLRMGSWLKVASGTTIIAEGENDLYLYVLIRGQANVIKNSRVLAGLGAGDVFGEISALAKTPRTAHVIAQSEVLCVRFEPGQIERLPADLQLKLVKKILFTLADRLTALNRKFCVT